MPDLPAQYFDPDTIRQGLMDGLRPEPKLTITEWADTYRFLDSSASAEPGKYSSSRTPYLREIMDALSPSSQRKVVIFQKGAQVGGSEIGFNFIGFCIHYAPGPILLVNPTQDGMQDNSRLRIAPMIEATPVLRERIAPAKSRGSANSLLFKKFPGGVLRMIGSNASAGFRSMPARYVMLDEIDEYPDDVGEQGSPLLLAEKRADTFGSKAKIFILSTPTTATSKIHAEFEKTDKNYYHVPCPHCDHFAPILWENIRYEKHGNDYTATLFCGECGGEIEERYKTWMLENGKWIASKPEMISTKTVGFHLSGLYSPVGWFSWADAARAHDEAYNVKNDSNLKKSFMNTVLGEIYEDDQDRPPWQRLVERSGEYKRNELPEKGPMFITAGVDVQRDRLEMEIVAWGMNRESWSVDYRIVFGDTSNLNDPCWESLAGTMRETWIVSGVKMPIAWTGIDTGDQAMTIYAVVNRLNNQGYRILAIKGRDSQLLPLAQGQRWEIDAMGKKKGRPLWNVGTSILKSELYGFLNLERYPDGTAPGGFCHFPEYGEDYFKGLTAEAVVIETNKAGYPKEVWKKLYARNEPLDCRNYARAVAAFNRMIEFTPEQFAVLRGQLASIAHGGTGASASPKKRRRKKGSIWNR